jgi:hypothetical protein
MPDRAAIRLTAAFLWADKGAREMPRRGGQANPAAQRVFPEDQTISIFLRGESLQLVDEEKIGG